MIQTYHFQGEDAIPSPALIYYKDILIQNTKTAISSAGSPDRLWPHVKSHKSRDFVQLQVTMGIKNFKCATIAEAEMVAQTDAQNILVAYPLIGPGMERFIQLTQSYTTKKFYALGDSLEQIAALGRLARNCNITINCLVDVNTGMNRTGVPLASVLTFYKEMAVFPGICASGLHCYDGERHEKEYAFREEKVLSTIDSITCIKAELDQNQLSCPIIIMGGSPSFPCYAENMKEVYYSPGTVFLYDRGYEEQFPDLPYTPGAAILTRVISHPAKGVFTLDTGYKAISAEQTIRGFIPELPDALESFQSEEHWTFHMKEGKENQRPALGSILYIIPWHVCPTSALYEEAHVISPGKPPETWPITARCRKINF